MSWLCRLDWHRYEYVGEKQEGLVPGVKTGWNHECVRCGERVWFASAAPPAPPERHDATSTTQSASMTWPAGVSLDGLLHGVMPRIYATDPDDPEAGLVHADMNAWAEAHPCSCTDEAIDPDCRCCG